MILLYRGVALSDEALKLYELKDIEFFTWNSFISTTEDYKIAH